MFLPTSFSLASAVHLLPFLSVAFAERKLITSGAASDGTFSLNLGPDPNFVPQPVAITELIAQPFLVCCYISSGFREAGTLVLNLQSIKAVDFGNNCSLVLSH
jgi:hypothetical protein